MKIVKFVKLPLNDIDLIIQNNKQIIHALVMSDSFYLSFVIVSNAMGMAHFKTRVVN